MSIADSIDTKLTLIKQKAHWTKKQEKSSNVMLKKCEKFLTMNNKLQTQVESALDNAMKA